MGSSIGKSRSVIAVEDDARVLDQISAALDATHVVLGTSDVGRALAWLENDVTIAAIIAGQTLRANGGLELLRSAQKLRPAARRILITNYEDLSSIVAGLHCGAVQRTIAKPINPRELVALVRMAPAAASAKPAGDSAAA